MRPERDAQGRFASPVGKLSAKLQPPADAARPRVTATRLGERLKGAWAHAIDPSLADLYLVKGVIPNHAVVQIFGDPSVGKTASALDLACHVALGREWRGRRVKKRPVAYLALEAPASVERRIIAWAQHHGVGKEKLPLYIIRGDINFTNPDDIPQLIGHLRHAEKEHGGFGLIFIDTQARTVAGADENLSSVAGALMKACEALREKLGATVVLIHHKGKDRERGARGHSSVFAALDAQIEVERGRVNVSKDRDGEPGATFGFALRAVKVGEDEDGEPVRAVVCVNAAPPPKEIPAQSKSEKLPEIARVALQALIEAAKNESPSELDALPAGAQAARESEWRKSFYESFNAMRGASASADSRQKAFYRAKNKLVDANRVLTRGDWWWPK